MVKCIDDARGVLLGSPLELTPYLGGSQDEGSIGLVEEAMSILGQRYQKIDINLTIILKLLKYCPLSILGCVARKASSL